MKVSIIFAIVFFLLNFFSEQQHMVSLLILRTLLATLVFFLLYLIVFSIFNSDRRKIKFSITLSIAVIIFLIIGTLLSSPKFGVLTGICVGIIAGFIWEWIEKKRRINIYVSHYWYNINYCFIIFKSHTKYNAMKQAKSQGSKSTRFTVMVGIDAILIVLLVFTIILKIII